MSASCEWFSPTLSLSVLLSPIAKILGKVGESLSRICCVRPPVERFTFVGEELRNLIPSPVSFLSLLPSLLQQRSSSTFPPPQIPVTVCVHILVHTVLPHTGIAHTRAHQDSVFLIFLQALATFHHVKKFCTPSVLVL